MAFIKNLFSSGTPESIKRVAGFIGWITAIVYIAIYDRTLIQSLLIISASLMGLETITNLFNKK